MLWNTSHSHSQFQVMIYLVGFYCTLPCFPFISRTYLPQPSVKTSLQYCGLIVFCLFPFLLLFFYAWIKMPLKQVDEKVLFAFLSYFLFVRAEWSASAYSCNCRVKSSCIELGYLSHLISVTLQEATSLYLNFVPLIQADLNFLGCLIS